MNDRTNGMEMDRLKSILGLGAVLLALGSALFADAGSEIITLRVHGMMKSRSGAT